ncbi:hypothetical protein P879_09182 [Paragonimus westermani]|uniref:Uncharacterized protein n=1 Tax=Paragonimus westermani TaxID=34504 RepID=A0A8T0D4L6_9TREM|nr:hypothetical protein P879_09182 [Paragonimus westermani]
MHTLFYLIFLTYNGNIRVIESINAVVDLLDIRSGPEDDFDKLASRSPESWQDGTFSQLTTPIQYSGVFQYTVTIKDAVFAGLQPFEQLWLANMKMNGQNLPCATSLQRAIPRAKCSCSH